MALRKWVLFAVVSVLVVGGLVAVERMPNSRPVPVVLPQQTALAPAKIEAPAAVPPSPAVAVPEPNVAEAKPVEPKADEPKIAALPEPAAPQPEPPIAVTPPAPAQPPMAALPPAPEPAPAPTVTVPMPPAAPPTAEDQIPAKKLFSKVELPSLGKAMAIGYYPHGCLQGGVELPVNGSTWQVMRLSRNRNWGHPALVKFLERFAPQAAKATGWKGVLIGDMAQPRGGPLPFGHLSHQIGLDVDIWFMPMPNRLLTDEEREKTSAINLVAEDRKHLNPKTWTPQHIAFIKTAADQPEVERVFVNAAIKQELCRVEDKKQDAWMSKVRPWYGHDDHIHVRLKCPADSPNCRKQPDVPEGDGCGKALDVWFSDKVLHPKPPVGPVKPQRPMMLADLPPACKTVLDSPPNLKAAQR